LRSGIIDFGQEFDCFRGFRSFSTFGVSRSLLVF
jgi:hypothetical protein